MSAEETTDSNGNVYVVNYMTAVFWATGQGPAPKPIPERFLVDGPLFHALESAHRNSFDMIVVNRGWFRRDVWQRTIVYRSIGKGYGYQKVVGATNGRRSVAKQKRNRPEELVYIDWGLLH